MPRPKGDRVMRSMRLTAPTDARLKAKATRLGYRYASGFRGRWVFYAPFQHLDWYWRGIINIT